MVQRYHPLCRVLVWVGLISLLINKIQSLSVPTPPPSSRRDLLWKLPIGASFTYGYGDLVYKALSVQNVKFPYAHEKRVVSVIAQSLLEADSASADEATLRVLEVGAGKDLRLLRGDLYRRALQQVNLKHSRIEITGIDLELPTAKVTEEAKSSAIEISSPEVSFQVQQGSITSRLPFPDGYFDSVVCCLTLCSVDDPNKAVAEMRRLIRSDGGTLGYIEHVAVNADEPYRFLNWQQTAFDPFQQRLADNCHLHRYTESTILSEFGTSGRSIASERFKVDEMWPVSCQACGVIKKLKA